MNIQPLNRMQYAIRFILTSVIFTILFFFVVRINPYLALLVYIINFIALYRFAAGRLLDIGVDPNWAIATIMPGACFVLMFPLGKAEKAKRIGNA